MNNYITIGILAHVDAGKTTLSEALLYTSGKIRKLGRVDHKDAFLDSYELERSRGITIFSKQAVFQYGGISYTLLDTPGHADFSPEMERTLQVLDMAILVISAADGVTSQVRLLWRLLDHYKVPTFIFVNKMDQPGADKNAVLSQLKDVLGNHCVDFDGVLGNHCVDFTESVSSSRFDRDSSVSEDACANSEVIAVSGDSSLLDLSSPELQEELAVCDDKLLEKFLEGYVVTLQDVEELVRSRKTFPCIFGSALRLNGVKELLDTLTSLCSTGNSMDFIQQSAKSTMHTSNSLDSSAPEENPLTHESALSNNDIFSARVYKISRDAQGNRLTHMKIISGSLKVRDTIQDEKIDQIRLYNGDKFEALPEATAGMIVAISGLSSTRAGEGLGALKGSVSAEVIQPILSCALILPDDVDTISFYKKIKSLESEEWDIIDKYIKNTNNDVNKIINKNNQIIEYYKSKDFLIIKNACDTLMATQKEFNEYIDEKVKSLSDLFGTSVVRNETSFEDEYNYIHPYKKSITPFTAEVSANVFASAENNPLEYVVKHFYPDKGLYPEQIRKLQLLIEELETLKDAKIIIENYKKDIQKYLSDVPSFIMENDEDGFYSRLGFATINENNLTVAYKFSYTSNGGRAQRSFTVPMTEETIVKLIEMLESKLTMSAFTKEQRSLMTSKLRQHIKERDAFTCKSCGNSIYKEPNLLLEIDHIIPVSKGGCTEEDNLQTLCWKCNRSKGDKTI